MKVKTLRQLLTMVVSEDAQVIFIDSEGDEVDIDHLNYGIDEKENICTIYINFNHN